MIKLRITKGNLWNWRLFEKNSCNDKHTNTIAMQLKKEEETFSDKTEEFYLTYVWWIWGLHKIIDQIEDIFRKKLWIQW